MFTAQDVIDSVDRIAPPYLAVPGDPAGLHAGSHRREVRSLLLTVDAGLAVVEEAVRIGADMIVAHHPRFYRGLSTLAETDVNGRRAAAIARTGVVVYSAHTCLDLAPGGTNDVLADIVGLRSPRPVTAERRERLIKLVVFVPTGNLEAVRRAVCDAGAGAIGDYSDCTFRVEGTGSFRCGAGTNPFIGTPGSFEEAAECRLETVFPESIRDRVVAAMLAAHPYEEVAYDLYAVLATGRVYGFGRVGELARPDTLAGLAERVAAATGSPMVQYAGYAGATVTLAAVWAGGGVDAPALLDAEPDVVVAGEAGYHETEAFLDARVGLITLGHGYSELPVLAPLAAKLAEALPGMRIAVASEPVLAMRNIPAPPNSVDKR